MEYPRPNPTPPIDVDSHRQVRKRSHHEMNSGDNNIRTRDSSSPIPGPTNAHSHTHDESSHRNVTFSGRAPLRRRLSSDAPSPAPRVPRSQVDLRRPAFMPPATYVDLTEDDSPPVRTTGPIRLRLPTSRSPSPQRDPARRRPFLPYAQVITVDLEDGETRRAPPPRRSSPEIEITGERTVPRRERPTTVAHDGGGQQARRAGGYGRIGNLFNFLRNNPTDEALETFTAERQEQNTREDLERQQRVLNAIRDATGHHRHPYEVAEVLIGHGRIDALEEGFELGDDVPIPVMMDYVTPGFAMGRNQRPRSPPYIEPSPPPEGFIKSTEEDDIVICPNCNDELGVGQDPLKRQVWIAKSCGHVYCGECTKNRPVKRVPKAAKMALKTKPFSKCVVEECGKSVSQPKSMVPLYL